MNEPISVQIGTNLPRGNCMNGRRRSKVKVTGSLAPTRDYIGRRPYGLCNLWPRHRSRSVQPLSRVDNVMQCATEISALNGGGGVAHSCNCPPPRFPDMRLTDALVLFKFIL